MNTRIAAFDVDAQKGFTELCPNELPVPEGHLIGAELNRMASVASLRVASKDSHPERPIWLAEGEVTLKQPLPYANANLAWPRHCVVGTRGHELLDALPSPLAYDFMVNKGVEPDLHPYGACYQDLNDTQSTGVIEWLHAKSVTHVIVGGLAYEHCVATTTLQLVRAGFIVALYEPATRGIDAEAIATMRNELIDAGVTLLDDAAALNAYAQRIQGGQAND